MVNNMFIFDRMCRALSDSSVGITLLIHSQWIMHEYRQLRVVLSCRLSMRDQSINVRLLFSCAEFR